MVLLLFFLCAPSFLWGSNLLGEEVLHTVRTIICKRTTEHPWVDMGGNVVPYSQDHQQLMNNSGEFFSIYERNAPEKLIATVNFFQWTPSVNLFECTIAVKYHDNRKGYGTEISLALINHMLSKYSPCMIVEERDHTRHNNNSKILQNKLSRFGKKDEYYDGYWCTTPDLSHLSYSNVTQALGVPTDNQFHPQYWTLISEKDA